LAATVVPEDRLQVPGPPTRPPLHTPPGRIFRYTLHGDSLNSEAFLQSTPAQPETRRPSHPPKLYFSGEFVVSVVNSACSSPLKIDFFVEFVVCAVSQWGLAGARAEGRSDVIMTIDCSFITDLFPVRTLMELFDTPELRNRGRCWNERVRSGVSSRNRAGCK
jgi:hypothetical protein